MPNNKRKNNKEKSQKFYRYMSVDELTKLLLGECLNNNTTWAQKAASESVGFCFLAEKFTGTVYNLLLDDGSSYDVNFRPIDFRSEWEDIAECHYRSNLEKNGQFCPSWEELQNLNKWTKKSYYKGLRSFIRNHVIVEFINTGHDFQQAIAMYNKVGTITEYCTTSYSLKTLCPVKFSRLSGKNLKWQAITTFKI